MATIEDTSKSYWQTFKDMWNYESENNGTVVKGSILVIAIIIVILLAIRFFKISLWKSPRRRVRRAVRYVRSRARRIRRPRFPRRRRR